MKYSVHQHWDPLKVCIVGRSYSPEFYSYITNTKVRSVLERIAKETEEDNQKLISVLESFGVEVLRPTVTDNYLDYVADSGKIMPPPCNPRDNTAMIGNNFYIDTNKILSNWDSFKGSGWPVKPQLVEDIPDWIVQECRRMFDVTDWDMKGTTYKEIVDAVSPYCNIVENERINTAEMTRVGRDLYFGTHTYHQDQVALKDRMEKLFPEYRCHVINTGGHADSTFCPVKPGLIVSLNDVPTYKDTFPGWEVVYLPGQSWNAVTEFLKLKEKNKGKWWVPGEELNDDFTNYVNEWMDHWVGYVEETVFDVNMLVIDEHNVICNNYNEQVFEAFNRHGITPHIVNLRHRYFWDGGLHCITSDIHREGIMNDYFPERG